jgi:tRNA-uridine 2-sulfurtransferase
MPRVIALLSGGLDSILAVRILQRQNLAIEGLNVRTPFDFSAEPAALAARDLGIPLTTRRVGEDYVELLRNPRFGYGKGVNPCLDCRIYMVRMARQLMEERGACAVASGEVLGQRPMSQKRQDLHLIARRAGLEGRLLRPLSAKHLDPTIPEQEGLIDRQQLHDFAGRGRRQLIALAEELGVRNIPTPSPGCSLTEKTFAPRLRDLLQFNSTATLWDCELLKIGRHFRVSPLQKVVLGRDAEENDKMSSLWASRDAVRATLVEPESFIGANALLCGPATEEALRMAGALMVFYTRQVDPDSQEVLVRVQQGSSRQVMRIDVSGAEAAREACRLIA